MVENDVIIMVTDTGKFKTIGNELESLLKNLTDSSNNKVFKSVLLGFPEEQFRGYEFPLAICYVKGANYQSNTLMKRNTPEYIDAVIGIIVTGDTRSRYEKIVDLMDLIQEKFETDDNWIHLNGKVRLTKLNDSALTIMENGENISSVAIFTLKHHVYK